MSFGSVESSVTVVAESLLLVEPAHLWVPEHGSTSGPEAADLAGSLGLVLDAEQRLALDVLLAERPDGRWVAFEAAVIAARQNLKTFLFKVIVLADLYLFDAELVVWTAHEFSTAMEAFRDVKELIDGAPFLSRRVRKITEANGEEGIEFTSGQRLRFKARTKTGGRGLTGDRVILDEAFALQPSHMGSLMPTMSAKSMHGNPQILYGSSAGQVGSAVLRSVRDRGRGGGDPSLAYIEWCAPEGGCATDGCDHHFGIKGCVLDDVERWRQANPALERRISIEFIAAERRSLPSEEFARERLGWWDEPAAGSEGMPLDAWLACGDDSLVLADPVALAVDVAPGHVAASIVACGGPLEVVASARGSSWVVDRLVDLRERQRPMAVGVDPAGPVGSLIPELEAAGFEIRSDRNPLGLLVMLDGRESVQACGALYAAVVDGVCAHLDQPVLNDAVAGAARRQVGDAWKWSRRDSSVDISPLVAATVARHLWSARKTAPPATPISAATSTLPSGSDTADLSTLQF